MAGGNINLQTSGNNTGGRLDNSGMGQGSSSIGHQSQQ